MNTREELLDYLMKAKNIIAQEEDIQKRCETAMRKMQVKCVFRPLKDSMARKVVFGVILLIFGAVTILKVIKTLKNGMASPMEMRSMLNGIILFLTVVLIALAVQWICLKYCDHANRKRLMNTKERNEEIDRNNEIVQREAEMLSCEKKELLETHGKWIDSWYPNGYHTVEAVEFFISMIQDFKADGIKEAVSLYDKELERKKEEEAQIRREQEERERWGIMMKLEKFKTMAAIVNAGANLSTAHSMKDIASSHERIADSLRRM